MITDYSENKTEELYNECCDDNCEPDEYDCIAAGIYERKRELWSCVKIQHKIK